MSRLPITMRLASRPVNVSSERNRRLSSMSSGFKRLPVCTVPHKSRSLSPWLGFLLLDEVAGAAEILVGAKLQVEQEVLERGHTGGQFRQHDIDPFRQILHTADQHGGTWLG